MTDAMAWESIHASREMDAVSWWQEAQEVWTDLIVGLAIPLDAPIVDIGAGSSMMVDALLAHGYCDLTAVDLSTAALKRTQQRVGAGVDVVVADVRHFVTDVPVALWHDRAVFHFLVDPEDQALYRQNLHASLADDGHAVIATFAPDGPEQCSGFPVQRYSPEDLAQTLDLNLEHGERRVHITPWGSEQAFTIAVMHR